MSELLNAESIEAIERLSQAATAEVFVSRPGDPPHVVYQQQLDGSYAATETVRKPLDVQLKTPSALVEFVASSGWVLDPEADEPSTKAEIYYDETAIVCVLDGDERRDRATCKLVLSPQYKWLRDVAPKQAYRQTDFVRLLRIDLRGCMAVETNLLGIVRQLKFDAAQQSVSNVQHGRESIGRTIAAEVAGTGAIPEEMALSIPVFENFPFIARVTCAVEVIVADQSFKLIPIPLDVPQAMEEAMAALAAVLETVDVPAFYGAP